MNGDEVQTGVTLLQQGLTTLHDAAGPHGSEIDRIAVLAGLGAVEQQMHRVIVDTVAALQRDGSFTAHGQKPVTALCDLLGLEHRDARRIVTAAEHVCPRVDLQGQILPARLPATAAAFHDGAIGLGHVEVITRVLDSPPARRLPPATVADAEQQIAAMATATTPTALRAWAVELLELLDQDGAEPDDSEPAPTNEMFLRPNPHGPGGRITARIDDAELYDAIAAIIDAKSAPLTKDDHRPLGRRQAEALAEVFGWVADHPDPDLLPTVGGNRPHLNILIRWEDLQAHARAAMLDFGGQMSAAAARMACCDACIIPIVLNGAGQPLDVGRAKRSIPDPLRRAVAARDRGCAHPGCNRTPSWCHVHHVSPGNWAGPPTWRTWSCCAKPTTGRSTPRNGP